MNVTKRIALFAGQADESYQSRFIRGFMKKSFEAGYDVCVFSMYRKYQDTPEREQGEANIFYLMNPEQFDGAIILKDSIQTENAAENLELHLKDIFNKPIVVIEKESDLFPSICTDCYSAVFELITHLIEVHGYRKIYCLTGPEFLFQAQTRLKAYQDQMSEHGLYFDESYYSYGTFWIDCARHLKSAA